MIDKVKLYFCYFSNKCSFTHTCDHCVPHEKKMYNKDRGCHNTPCNCNEPESFCVEINELNEGSKS